MKNIQKSLSLKIILSIALAAVLTAALVAVFIRVTSEDRLTKLIIEQQSSSLQQALTDYYARGGSWQGIAENWQELEFQTSVLPAPDPDKNPPEADRPDFGRRPRNLFGMADAAGVVLVQVDKDYPPGATLPASVLAEGTPVTVNQVRVGTLLTTQRLTDFNPEEALFLRRTNHALLLAVAGAVALALLIGVLLARTLTRPLRSLTLAAQKITAGELDQQVKVTGRDEIGQLAEAFNRMSQEIARVNQQRKQMTADVAHELRTPLTVIAGYVESMQDGVLEPTPARLNLIYAEIERLMRLVGDLRMLSQADAGELTLNPQQIAAQQLVQEAAERFSLQAQQQGIALNWQVHAETPPVRADEARMMQVLGNLVVNALRYTPDGGSVTITAEPAGGGVLFSVVDNGSGIDPAELPLIFERFHRADKSRHTESGETGLGLAIVKAIVEAHGGRVEAQSQVDGGTRVDVWLPAISATG